MKLLRRGTAIDERANFLRSKLLKSRVWDALCECEEEIAKHRISRTKSCGDYLLARPAPDAFAPSWLYLSSETSNLCPLINPLFLPYSWFRTPTLWLFLELWEVRSHLCLQRGPAAFKGRRGVLTTPCSLPIPQAPPFPICSGALVSKKKKEKYKGEKPFLSLRCLLSLFPLWAAWVKKKHAHTHSLSLFYVFSLQSGVNQAVACANQSLWNLDIPSILPSPSSLFPSNFSPVHQPAASQQGPGWSLELLLVLWVPFSGQFWPDNPVFSIWRATIIILFYLCNQKFVLGIV